MDSFLMTLKRQTHFHYEQKFNVRVEREREELARASIRDDDDEVQMADTFFYSFSRGFPPPKSLFALVLARHQRRLYYSSSSSSHPEAAASETDINIKAT